MKIFSRKMFYDSDNVKLTTSVKTTNKLDINKYMFILLYPTQRR